MNNFIYHTPTKIYFGKDEELKVGKIIKEYNAKKVMIHFGGKSAKESGLLDRIENCLREEAIDYIEFGKVVPNPELCHVRRGIEICKDENVDFILAVGGGSVLDSAKAIANGAANPQCDVWDFNTKKAQPTQTIKKGAVLTISAAGSEMSASCVITNEKTGEKRGYSSPLNRMDFAIENPELTYSVNAYQTACGIVDIGMHTIERYFCVGSETYLTDSIAEGMYPEIAHGAGLAALWCSWARYVYKSSIKRFLQYAKNVWNIDIDFENPEKTVLAAIDKQENFYKSIGMPISLKELGVRKTDLEKLAYNCSFQKTRVIGEYKKLGYDEILDIYKMAYEV